MFKHCMEIVHNQGNVVLPERFSLDRVNFHNVFQWQRIQKLRDYLEVYSLSSVQVFL